MTDLIGYNTVNVRNVHHTKEKDNAVALDKKAIVQKKKKHLPILLNMCSSCEFEIFFRIPSGHRMLS